MTGSARTTRWLVPVALLACFAVVQVLYLRPPSPQDGMNYFERTAAFPDVGDDHQSLRVGLLLPVRMFQAVFGTSEAAYYAVPLLAGALLVLGTYWLGSLLFSPAVGAGAAVVLLLSDVFLVVSSVLLPDHVATALLVAGLCLVVVAARSASPHDHLLLAGAGLLFGWAYLVREFVVLAFPAVVAVAVAERIPWRKLVWLAAPAAGLFAGELVLNGVLHGSPLERLFAGASHGGQRDSITDSRWDAVVRLPRALADEPGGDPLLVLLALVPVAAMVRDRALRATAAWFFAFWLALTLGTGLVVPSFRFLIAGKLRYWLPVLPAVLLGGLGVVHWALRHPRLGAKRWLPGAGVVALAAIVAVTGFSQWRGRDGFRVNGADQLTDLRSWLASEGADVGVLWTDHFTARLLPLYSRTVFGDRVWDGEVRAFDREGGTEFVPWRELRGGTIVLYRFGYRLLPGQYEGLPDYLRRREGDGRTLEVFRPDRSLVVVRVAP